MIESEYIKKTDAMNIVKRTHGDYVAAWSEIRELPAVEIAKEKKLVASWKWDGNSWVCGNCKYPSIAHNTSLLMLPVYCISKSRKTTNVKRRTKNLG